MHDQLLCFLENYVVLDARLGIGKQSALDTFMPAVQYFDTVGRLE